MGTRSLLRSSLSALALIAATAAFPSASHAITFNLTEDHCIGGRGIPPFGSVTLTQNGTMVEVDVDLFGTNAFVKTGSVDFQAFKFNASGVVVGDVTVDQNNATIADLTAANNLGNIFVADVIGSTGNTGPVAAIAPVPCRGRPPGRDLGNRWASLLATASADCLNRLARHLRAAPIPSAFRASDDVG
jgi:hypothetical protein